MNNPLPKIGARMSGSVAAISWTRFSIRDRTLFARRLAFLMRAGVPLLESLELVRVQTASSTQARVYEAVIADVARGQFLAASLGKHRRYFGDFAINLIRAGEASGILADNLGYLADELEKRHALRRAIASALVYPACITVATLGVTGLLAAYIFPKLMPIFTGLDVDLPFSTRVLIAVSDYLRHWGMVTVIAVAAAIALFFALRRRSERLQLHSDRLLLRLPIAGPLARAYNTAALCRTLGLLLKSGIVLSEALTITAETSGNRVFAAVLRASASAIVSGEPLARALGRHGGIVPDLVGHLVAVGERTGNLAGTLLYLSELYETEVDERAKNLASAIEPVLMIVMGVLVGAIAVSVITPIYEITQHLQPK